MKLAMIVALGRNRAIGIDNVMPWHIPDDLKYFKAQTMGKPCVMGRRTLESIGKPLPGRPNIVVTRDPAFRPDGVTVVADVERALEHADAMAKKIGAREIMIVGGGQIYAQLIDRADRLYLTEIDLTPDAHTFFPDYRAAAAWRETGRQHHPAAAGPAGLRLRGARAGVKSVQCGEFGWRRRVAQNEFDLDRCVQRNLVPGQPAENELGGAGAHFGGGYVDGRERRIAVRGQFQIVETDDRQIAPARRIHAPSIRTMRPLPTRHCRK